MKTKAVVFTNEEEAVHRQYLILKAKASANVKNAFEKYPEIYQRIENTVHADGLMAVATFFTPGEKGYGYFQISLMLNIRSYLEKRYSHFLYIAVGYVPMPDIGYDWDVNEFHQSDAVRLPCHRDFIRQLQLLADKETVCQELIRISNRKYSTCVTPTDKFAIQ